jgi:hypothetical protein
VRRRSANAVSSSAETAGGANGELVTAQPGDRISRSHVVAQPVSSAEKDLVPGIVAVGVVDRLEVVEIDVEHAHPHARPALSGAQGGAEPVVEKPPMAKPVNESWDARWASSCSDNFRRLMLT